MKQFVPIFLLASFLCGCGKAKYDYSTFVWPDNAEHSLMKYWDAQGNEETQTNIELDAVLEEAQTLGWEYVGSAGHTIIMRRPHRHSTGSIDMSGDFIVEASN